MAAFRLLMSRVNTFHSINKPSLFYH